MLSNQSTLREQYMSHPVCFCGVHLGQICYSLFDNWTQSSRKYREGESSVQRVIYLQ